MAFKSNEFEDKLSLSSLHQTAIQHQEGSQKLMLPIIQRTQGILLKVQKYICTSTPFSASVNSQRRHHTYYEMNHHQNGKTLQCVQELKISDIITLCTLSHI